MSEPVTEIQIFFTTIELENILAYAFRYKLICFFGRKCDRFAEWTNYDDRPIAISKQTVVESLVRISSLLRVCITISIMMTRTTFLSHEQEQLHSLIIFVIFFFLVAEIR